MYAPVVTLSDSQGSQREPEKPNLRSPTTSSVLFLFSLPFSSPPPSIPSDPHPSTISLSHAFRESPCLLDSIITFRKEPPELNLFETTTS
ncbi:hypothetical protein DTO166G4_9282 [Paecilomyces variotii]|nr:hypothetical protein DTO032I3_3307 [Paecilomyces variotii]KAJ9205001.1 hypothetical protein DTO164E3_1624 [Paecilomyces variotii]KAJ9206770.1 hypothetical protein DTO166G4_9282 [Paecilomyces variotii]KAJ9226565.1 hypothetical protein DTO169C6_1293 [Paecilomyces variotii]KAJ9243027.1 hypothetical protein DTO166G5_131 [Paecilomyces variotii]